MDPAAAPSFTQQLHTSILQQTYLEAQKSVLFDDPSALRQDAFFRMPKPLDQLLAQEKLLVQILQHLKKQT